MYAKLRYFIGFYFSYTNVILLIINGIKAFIMKKETKLSTIVHLAVLIIWIIYINIK